MDCDIISANIGACTDKIYKGYERLGVWTDYENIDLDSIVETDGKVTFSLKSGQFYNIWDDSKKPFDGSKPMSYVSSKHGYNLFSDIVMFPLKAHKPENSGLVSTLAKQHKIVVILTQKEVGTEKAGKYPVFGLNGGLYLKTPISDASSDVAWDLEFEDMNTSSAGQFIGGANAAAVETNYHNVVDYEVITGLSIALGGAIYIEVDQDKSAKIILSDGTVLNSDGGGIIETTADVAGEVIILVQKNTETFFITNSDFTGNMNFVVGDKNNMGIAACNFTTAQCDYILDILIENGEVIGLHEFDFTDNAEMPTPSKVEEVESLGWTVSGFTGVLVGDLYGGGRVVYVDETQILIALNSQSTDDITILENEDYSATELFLSTLNSSNENGYNDWRLPTLTEGELLIEKTVEQLITDTTLSEVDAYAAQWWTSTEDSVPNDYFYIQFDGSVQFAPSASTNLLNAFAIRKETL